MITIYALLCPESGRPRYVGKTKVSLVSRLAAHICKAKGFHTDSHCSNWIRSLIARGLKPEIVEVSQLTNSSNWQQVEIDTIAAYRRSGYDLTNATAGGDGFHDMDQEVLSRRVATRRTTMSDPARHAAFVQATTKSRQTVQVRKKQSRGLKAAWSDPEKKARFMDGMHTPEAVERRSKATRERYADPEFRAKHAEAVRQRFKDPKHLEQIRAAGAKRWRDYYLSKKKS